MAGNAPRRPTPSGDLSARARVLVVEDDAFTRTTVCGALQNAGIRVAASSGSAAEALGLAAEHRPHAAVVDLDLGPGPTGLDLAARLRRDLPSIGVVVLTSYADPRLTGRNIGPLPGGTVYLTKAEMTSCEVLTHAIDVSMRLAANPAVAATPTAARPAGLTAALTDDQVEVAHMIADGLSNAEIGARRGVSPATVERTILATANALGIESTSSTNRRVLIAREFLRESQARGYSP
jgi:DNA-binding NarL/FixJ family response regulator